MGEWCEYIRIKAARGIVLRNSFVFHIIPL